MPGNNNNVDCENRYCKSLNQRKNKQVESEMDMLLHAYKCLDKP
jgi:hypothetical protein